MYSNQNPLDETAESAHRAVANGAHAVHDGIDQGTRRAAELRDEAASRARRLAARASELAHNGADWARESGQRVRSKVEHVSDRTVGYVRDEPVRSMMVAAAAGALVFALISMLSSRRRH